VHRYCLGGNRLDRNHFGQSCLDRSHPDRNPPRNPRQAPHFDATCLGLTCKMFYSIHRQLHGTVKFSKEGYPLKLGLHDRLKSWMPSHLRFTTMTQPPKYITAERWHTLQARWRRGLAVGNLEYSLGSIDALMLREFQRPRPVEGISWVWRGAILGYNTHSTDENFHL